ncbi:MAG: hypothetical protein IKJ73_07215 [Lachnospiraceae bacterium]|nr:hypothetical protein [Lachnospiraceae bacterium]
MNMRDWIVKWFVDHTGKTESEIVRDAKENYFDLGYIDSFEFIELISDLEEAGIQLNNDSFEDRRFATIEGLIEILSDIN